ncbi:UNVERIFIED_CONTAM: hypothetical protein PYX00_011902 [Menopon gallinae]|uniref:PDZ domain-containing protein n=1 Tax=Menopon gallinae TaxID=328185 RepID=A0AAW2H923_9NEOP
MLMIDYVKRFYVDEPDANVLFEGAMKGLFESLEDPYSQYLTFKEMEELKNTTVGDFAGIGVYHQKKNPKSLTVDSDIKEGYIYIVSPIEGSPAYSAGLQPGDYITHIQGESVIPFSADDISAKLKGKEGEPVTLTILRGKDLIFDVTLKRQNITIPTVKYAMLSDQIAYVRIMQFTPHTAEDTQSAIKNLQQKGMRALILDLRMNPGGVFNSAIKIADFFFKEGTLVSTKSRIRGENVDYQATDSLLVEPDIPLVALIDKGSASASEVLVGALKDRGRAWVIGEKSYGKGVVQNVIPGYLGTGFKLTTARYYTPKGESIDKKGIEPNQNVKVEQMSRAQERSYKKMLDEKIFDSFVKDNPQADQKQVEAFMKKLHKEGYDFDNNLVGRILNSLLYQARGQEVEYYDIYFPSNDMKVMIPVTKIQELKIRAVATSEQAKEALKLASGEKVSEPSDWKKRYEVNHKLLKNGDVLEFYAIEENNKALATLKTDLLALKAQKSYLEDSLSKCEENSVLYKNLQETYFQVLSQILHVYSRQATIEDSADLQENISVARTALNLYGFSQKSVSQTLSIIPFDSLNQEELVRLYENFKLRQDYVTALYFLRLLQERKPQELKYQKEAQVLQSLIDDPYEQSVAKDIVDSFEMGGPRATLLLNENTPDYREYIYLGKIVGVVKKVVVRDVAIIRVHPKEGLLLYITAPYASFDLKSNSLVFDVIDEQTVNPYLEPAFRVGRDILFSLFRVGDTQEKRRLRELKEKAKETTVEQLRQEAYGIYNSLVGELKSQDLRRINETYSLYKVLDELVTFDYYPMLKLFDPHLPESDFKYKPKFVCVEGQKGINFLKNFSELLNVVAYLPHWDQVFLTIKVYNRGVDPAKASFWQKIIKDLAGLKKSGLIESIIHLLDDNMSFAPRSVLRVENLCSKYLEGYKDNIDSYFWKLQQEEEKKEIGKLMTLVFTTEQLTRLPMYKMKNYSEEVSARISSKSGGRGYKYCTALWYLKAFVIEVLKTQFKEIVNLMVVKGKWRTSQFSRDFSDALHGCMGLSEDVVNLDEMLAENNPYGKRVFVLIHRVSKDRSATEIFKQTIEDINGRAYAILKRAFKKFGDFDLFLKEIKDDYLKDPSNRELLLNWKELESEVDPNTGLPAGEAFKEINEKLNSFMEFLHLYLN